MSCPCTCCSKWLPGVALLALLSLSLAGMALAPNAGKDEKKPETPKEKAPAKSDVKGDPYLLDHCAVCDQKFDEKHPAMTQDVDGREFRFCCKECAAKFKAEPAKFTAKVDEELVKQQLPFYPLTQCVVMPADDLKGAGTAYNPEKESEHDVPVNLIYKNRLVRFCCGDCVPKFQKNPGEYLKKLDTAVIEKQSPTYALDVCPISGEKLGGMGEPVNKVVGNRLVKLCCKACTKSLNADPVAALAKLDAATKDKKAAATP